MSKLHQSTFEYLKPTNEQIAKMSTVRHAFSDMAAILCRELPDGPDKTYILRKMRECAMWANVTITREADGTPRLDPVDPPGGIW